EQMYSVSSHRVLITALLSEQARQLSASLKNRLIFPKTANSGHFCQKLAESAFFGSNEAFLPCNSKTQGGRGGA
ncbi:MAG: hypothetical protein ACXQTR_05400, partial [Candidatus Methanospirareceae archaeon]